MGARLRHQQCAFYGFETLTILNFMITISACVVPFRGIQSKMYNMFYILCYG
jgi:hypothetical protein